MQPDTPAQAIKMHSYFPAVKAIVKHHQKKPQIRAMRITFPGHGHGPGLGTRLLHKDLAEPLLSMEHGSSGQDCMWTDLAQNQ